MVELRTRKREMGGDVGNHDEKLRLSDLGVQVNYPSPIWQVLLWIMRAITPIQCVLNEISYIIPHISHLRTYPPYYSPLHSPFLFHVHNSTIIAEHTIKSSFFNSLLHDHELTLSTACTEYSIHWVQHPPMIFCLPFILMVTSWPLNIASASGLPSYKFNSHQPALHESSKVRSLCLMSPSKLTEEYSLIAPGMPHINHF